MLVDRWWIDEPVLIGSANPSDADLESLRRDGFSVIVCLLDLQEQSSNYDKSLACASGWNWHSIPVPDFAAPTVAQIEQFLTLVSSSIPEKKVVVHCRGGIGRTGTMGAAYWIAKGLSWEAAIAHIRERRQYAVENRKQEAILREFEESRDRTRGGPRSA
jgi:atypical dual specificity phosphatase